MEREKPIQVALRLPPVLHARLRDLAERERRSLHAQILYMLERFIAEDEADERRPAAERR